METIALIISIVLLATFLVQLIKRLISIKGPTKIHLKVGDKSFTLSEKANENDARKIIKYLKAD